ncbi:MAG: transcriptional regulator [Thermoplasmata archaeon]
MDPRDLAERQWCEYAVPNFLPSLRANIVLALSQRFGMSQRQIAKRLGLSQAAVSHYSTYRRGSQTPLRAHPGLSKYAKKLAGRIAGGLSGPRLTAAICGICTSFRQDEGVEPCFCLYAGVSKPDFLASLGDGIGFPRQPCETFVVRRLLPFIRSDVAHHLSGKRGQKKVASALGVSQPAISHYVASKRGEDPTLDSIPDLKEGVEDLAGKLEEGLSSEGRKNAICQLCVDSRKRGLGRVRSE